MKFLILIKFLFYGKFYLEKMKNGKFRLLNVKYHSNSNRSVRLLVVGTDKCFIGCEDLRQEFSKKRVK